MKLYYIGIDVHSKKTVFVAGSDAGGYLIRGTVDTTPEGLEKMVRKLINKIPQGERYRVIVGMESGSSTYRVFRMLRNIGVEVRVFHAREVRDLVSKKKQKTDKRDAEVIYREMFGQHFVQFSYIPGTDHEAMVRTLISRREGYVSDRSRAIVKTKALLRQWGLLTDSGRTLTSKTGWEKLLKRLKSLDEESWQVVTGWDAGLDILEDIIGMTEKSFGSWKAAQANIDDCEARIKDIIRKMDEKCEDFGEKNEKEKKRQKYMKELKKEFGLEKGEEPKEEKKLNIAERINSVDRMTGIGWLSAMKMVFLIGDPERFRNSSAVKSYFGLIPSEYSSGGMTRKGHLTKSGNQIGRTTLTQIAKQAARLNHPLHPMYVRLKHKRRANVAAIAVASRLIRIIWSMLRDGTEFDPMKLHIFLVNKPVKGKKAKTKGKPKTKLVAVEEKVLLDFMKTNKLGPEALESSKAKEYYEAMVKSSKAKEARY